MFDLKIILLVAIGAAILYLLGFLSCYMLLLRCTKCAMHATAKAVEADLERQRSDRRGYAVGGFVSGNRAGHLKLLHDTSIIYLNERWPR